MNHCAALKARYEGVMMKDLPELRTEVDEVDTNVKSWTTTYRCRTCGTRWVEEFEQRGHGEVPSVRRA